MWSGLTVSNSSFLREMRPKRRSTFLTVVFLAFVILTFFISYAAFGKEPTGISTLRSLHIVFRHGARNPTTTYSTDPYRNRNWRDGKGALTNEGKQQLFQLGQTLRKLYGEFIGDHYNADELSVLSSYAPRCQMSAMTLLAALFPPKGDQLWNNDLLWQPIPVNPIPRDIDNIITCKAKCLAFSTEKFKSDIELNSQLSESDRHFFKELSITTGEDIKTIDQVEQIYYTLAVQKEQGLELPDWTHTLFTDRMRSMAAENLASYTRTETLKKFQAGQMLDDWIKHFKNDNKVKLFMYSGHDLTLVNIMRTIGVDDMILPEYGAALIVELHQSGVPNKDKYIKLLYLNSSSSIDPHDLIIPDCKNHCPLQQFINFVQKYIPQDWKKECGN